MSQQLAGGVGQVGDKYEQHADDVAARVGAGQSAGDLLAEYSDTNVTQKPVQAKASEKLHNLATDNESKPALPPPTLKVSAEQNHLAKDNNSYLMANLFDDAKGGLQKIGENVWGGIEGGKQKLSDYTAAIALSIHYIPNAIKQRVDAVLREALIGLAIGLVGAAGVVSVTTVLGAAIGSLAGGFGAAPGAAVGYEVGMILLEWMGLLFLAKWLADRMGGITIAFGDFLTTVWNANGNHEAIDEGAQKYADAVAQYLALILEAWINWYMLLQRVT